MKKIVLVLAVCCAMMAQAASYSYLVFTNTSGSVTVLSVTNLTMNVEGTSLQVTNDDGTVNFVLTELASMQFSNDPQAIENVLDGDRPVQVFSLSGVSLGTFGSLVEAAQQLNAGAYVISNGKKSQTIILQ